MTKQEMLDVINMKIARTGGGTGSGETWYYLPIMIGDVLDYIEILRWFKSPDSIKQITELVSIMKEWKNKRESLDQQSYETISYIYSLL